MEGLTLLGIATIILANVFLSPGEFSDVRVGWGGIDRSHQTHLLDITSATQSDNYIIDSKNEENPRYSTLSVRPDFTKYLTATGYPARGLFQYKNLNAGIDIPIMADSTGLLALSGGGWSRIFTSIYDSPWEGQVYSDPSMTRLYLCNGQDLNKKYTTAGLFNMQNQDQETNLTGTVWFTQNSGSATGDATAISNLTTGKYIKYGTAGTDSDWYEILALTGTNITLERIYTLASTSSASCVLSSNVVNSRHITEFEGHTVLGYTNVLTTTSEGNSAGSGYYNLTSAYGVAQGFIASANNLQQIKLILYRGTGTTGNVIIKIKSTLASTSPLTTITYPIASLPTATTETTFSAGNITTTIGGTYFITIERENSSASPVFIWKGNSYAGGNAYWTYNSGGFNATWNTGGTTIETQPANFAGISDDNDTYIDSTFPNGNSSGIDTLYATYNSTQAQNVILYAPIQLGVNSDFYNFYSTILSVEVYIIDGGTWRVSRLITPNKPSQATWANRLTGTAWGFPGATKEGTDITSLNSTTIIRSGLSNNADISDMAKNWIYNNNYGVLITDETVAGVNFIYSSNNTAPPDNYPPSYYPKWIQTTITGSTESSQDIYFKLVVESSNASTIMYSKRYKPENFPTLNTFQIPGAITGMAGSGGYLIVAGKNPDALNIYRETGDTTDGLGIDFVTRINNITFGSSKSIAYLPKEDSFIFYSGLGVYKQLGLQTILLSGKIREEAKLFNNYRNSMDYYNGSANVQPMAVILPTKDTYLLSVPNTGSLNNYIYAYNYANDTWTRWTALTPLSMMTRYSGGSEPQLYYTDNTGQTYTMNTTGSTTTEATLVWFFSGKDITKFKHLDKIELWGRMDNPLEGCIVTIEVQSTNPVSDDTVTTPLRQTIAVSNNYTTDAQKQLLFTDIGLTAREFKITLTQKAGLGAISWRTIRYKGNVTDGN